MYNKHCQKRGGKCMTNKTLTLKDSVLNLRLPKEAIHCLEYFKLFTISDLLGFDKELRKDRSIYAEVSSKLEKYGLKFDSKLSYPELCERNRQREEILNEQFALINQYNPEILMASDLSVLDIPKKAISKLKNVDINTVGDLLKFNSLELSKMDVLVDSLIIKVDEGLAKYGLSLMGIKRVKSLIAQAKVFGNKVSNEESAEDIQTVETEKTTKRRKMADDYELWKETYDIIAMFFEENGHIVFKRGYYYKGIHGWEWLSTQRTNRREGRLSDEAISALDKFNMIWEPRTKEGREQEKAILTSLGIKQVKVVDGEQIYIMMEEIKEDSNEQSELILEQDITLNEQVSDVQTDDTAQRLEENAISEDDSISDDSVTSIDMEEEPKEESVCEIDLADDEQFDELSEVSSTLSILDLQQLYGSLVSETSELEKEIQEKQELISQIEALQARQAELLAESKKLDLKIASLMDTTALTNNGGRQYKRGVKDDK